RAVAVQRDHTVASLQESVESLLVPYFAVVAVGRGVRRQNGDQLETGVAERWAGIGQCAALEVHERLERDLVGAIRQAGQDAQHGAGLRIPRCDLGNVAGWLRTRRQLLELSGQHVEYFRQSRMQAGALIVGDGDRTDHANPQHQRRFAVRASHSGSASREWKPVRRRAAQVSHRSWHAVQSGRMAGDLERLDSARAFTAHRSPYTEAKNACRSMSRAL